jgi:chromosomal replication initiation ATPase DnaA
MRRLLTGYAVTFNRRHELKTLGYDLKKIAERAGEIYRMDPRYILSRGRQRRRVDARSLVCYWAVRELGMALTHLARDLAMSPSAVSYAVERGEVIASDNNYQLIDY